VVINEHILKITGSAVLAGPLQLDHEYSIGVVCNISGITDKSNNNGSINKTYKAEQTGLALISNDLGKKQYTKGKKTLSSKLRGALWHYYNENDINLEFDTFYNSMLCGMIGNVSKIVTFIKERQENENEASSY